ncbi:Hemicentin-2 [Halotydeus destructor]|nr:Hemicentin-2 [Halotydeus destructor]
MHFTKYFVLVFIIFSLTSIADAKKRVKPAKSNAKTINAYANYAFRINCGHIFDNKNKGFQVVWTRNGEVIPASSKIIKKNGRVLQVKRAKLADSGNYSCESTVFGEVERMIFQVKIKELKKGPPVFLKHPRRPLDVQRVATETVRLSCPFAGIPRPTIEWLYEGEPLVRAKTEVEVIAKQNATLLLRDSHPDDSGIYTCVVRNQHGTIKADIYVEVLVDGQLPPTCRHTHKKIFINPDQLLKFVRIECECNGHDEAETRFEKLIPTSPDCVPADWDDDSCGVFVGIEGHNNAPRNYVRHAFRKDDMLADFAEFFENDTGIYRCVVEGFYNEFAGTLYEVVLGYEHNRTLASHLQGSEASANIPLAISLEESRTLFFAGGFASICLVVCATVQLYLCYLTRVARKKLNGSIRTSPIPIETYLRMNETSCASTSSSVVTDV